jgi:hypothetical protein
MNYDYFEQNIFLPQIKPLLFNRLKPDEEIAMENVYLLGMTTLKDQIEKAKLRLSEFGNQERIIKLYSIISYLMKKEDNTGVNSIDILVRPLLLLNIIDKECKCIIQNNINNAHNKTELNNKTEFSSLLEKFDFVNIDISHLFALLFWFRLERTLKYHDANKYLYINDKQEKVYLYGNEAQDIHYNVMNNIVFMSNVSGLLRLQTLYVIAIQKVCIANLDQTTSIKKLDDEFSKIIENVKTTAESKYIKEKQKGGKNSNQDYQPLKTKVESLCDKHKHKYDSALKLCNKIAKVIEAEYKHLLKDFKPYKNYKKENSDWIKPTFYNWCNEIYKNHKNKK